ncbi:hypothetical protein ABT282_10855 [Streptomyces sp. NPDC000927]|uniref:hypothetical protein n=1 Tax=unclassified Streptomyces TaxID=2593676 RepID=UPI00332C8CCC
MEVTPRLLAKQGESATGIIDILRENGFHAYTLTNDYDPTTYPRTMRHPQPPVRCTTVPEEMTDLVFRCGPPRVGALKAPALQEGAGTPDARTPPMNPKHVDKERTR